jgi:hypothetical protein
MRSMIVAGVVLAIAALSACAPGASTGTTRATALPPGITIDVYQGRFDTGDHALEVSIHNAASSPFIVKGLRFSSPVFSPIAYQRAPSTVRAGTTTDFRLPLPLADCSAADGPATVRLEYSFDGTVATIETTPADRMGQLPGIRAEDCRLTEVEAVAEIAAVSPIGYTTVGTRKAAILTFRAVPTGAGGTLVIDDVHSTIMFGLLDGESDVIRDSLPLGLDVGSSAGPVTFALTLAPARCDPHAFANDRRGAYFPVTVTTTSGDGRIFLGVSDAQRAELLDYMLSVCGTS